MAKTANEKLLDQMIRHQIGMLRYSEGLGDEMVSILGQVEKDLVGRVASSDTKRWTGRRLDRLLRAVRDAINEAHVAMGKGARESLRELAKGEAAFIQERMGGVIPQAIGVEIVIPDANTLNQIVTQDPFQGKFMREWTKELSDVSYRDARDAIRIGALEGESNPQIARRLRSVFGTSKNRARTWTRTAVNHVSNAARQKTMEQNSSVIKGVQWVSTLDSRTTPICMLRDGEIYELREGPRPPAHPNCRSTTVPVLKSFREIGIDANELPESTRASMDGQVPAKMNYNSWLRSQVNNSRMDVVRDALGVKRAKLFAAGGLKIDRFVNSQGSLRTLSELYKREKKLFDRLDISP